MEGLNSRNKNIKDGGSPEVTTLLFSLKFLQTKLL